MAENTWLRGPGWRILREEFAEIIHDHLEAGDDFRVLSEDDRRVYYMTAEHIIGKCIEHHNQEIAANEQGNSEPVLNIRDPEYRPGMRSLVSMTEEENLRVAENKEGMRRAAEAWEAKGLGPVMFKSTGTPCKGYSEDWLEGQRFKGTAKD